MKTSKMILSDAIQKYIEAQRQIIILKRIIAILVLVISALLGGMVALL